MNDQPTPETDEMFTDNVPEDAQIVAFCERLERERNAARADVARLRNALEECFLHIRHAKGCATKHIIWKPCDCGMPEASKLAREALATLTK